MIDDMQLWTRWSMVGLALAGLSAFVSTMSGCQSSEYQYPVECRTLCQQPSVAYGPYCNAISQRDCLVDCDDVIRLNSRVCGLCRIGQGGTQVEWGAPSLVSEPSCANGTCNVFGSMGMCSYQQSEGPAGLTRCGRELAGAPQAIACERPSFNPAASCSSCGGSPRDAATGG